MKESVPLEEHEPQRLRWSRTAIVAGATPSRGASRATARPSVARASRRYQRSIAAGHSFERPRDVQPPAPPNGDGRAARARGDLEPLAGRPDEPGLLEAELGCRAAPVASASLSASHSELSSRKRRSAALPVRRGTVSSGARPGRTVRRRRVERGTRGRGR